MVGAPVVVRQEVTVTANSSVCAIGELGGEEWRRVSDTAVASADLSKRRRSLSEAETLIQQAGEQQMDTDSADSSDRMAAVDVSEAMQMQ